jgi:uncharacterized membrane protein YecN with MAPEG domain
VPVISAFYAGLLGLLAIAIAVQCGRVRGKTEITLGDGGNPELQTAMRRHANFVEFVPLVLVLIALLELNGVSKAAIHGLGAGLLVARLCHAVGFGSEGPIGVLRAVGAAGSTLVLLIASIWSIVVFI